MSTTNPMTQEQLDAIEVRLGCDTSTTEDVSILLAEVERLRALTTVDKAMVERTAKVLFLDRSRTNTEDKWARFPEGVRDSWRMDVRAVLRAAFTPEKDS